MAKCSNDKKLLLGSALAGLIIAGPGLSLTTQPSKFFQTAQMEVGYRLAQAADEKKSDVPATTTDTTKKDGDKAKDGHCSGDKAKDGKCGAGKCSGDKAKDGHCSGDKAKEGKCAPGKCAPGKCSGGDKSGPPAATKGSATDHKCGTGACGGGK